MFFGVGQIIIVDCYLAVSTGSAARTCNFRTDFVLLQLAILLHFCHNRGFVSFGWWVGGLAWLSSHCQTHHGQKSWDYFLCKMSYKSVPARGYARKLITFWKSTIVL